MINDHLAQSIVKPVLSKYFGENQKVVAKDRCLLNIDKFTLIFLLWDLKNGI